MFIIMDRIQILLHSHFKQSSESLPMKLPLLDEPAKHLRLHEDLQEAAHGFGWDGFAKTLSPKEGRGRGGG